MPQVCKAASLEAGLATKLRAQIKRRRLRLGWSAGG